MTDYSGGGFGGTIDWGTAEVENRSLETPKSAIATWDSAGDAVPLTGTQGDVLYYAASGVVSKLGAGTSGQFLKTQGAGANPTWAGIGTLVFLGSQILSGTAQTLTVTGLSTASYPMLRVLVVGKTSATDNRVPSITFNADGGANYQHNISVNGGANTLTTGATAYNLERFDNTDWSTIDFIMTNTATQQKIINGMEANALDSTAHNIVAHTGRWGNTASTVTEVKVDFGAVEAIAGSALYVWGVAGA